MIFRMETLFSVDPYWVCLAHKINLRDDVFSNTSRTWE